MNLLYLFICIGMFAIGDLLSVKTKAKMSSVFIALILFLIGFLTNILPDDIIQQAGLSQIGSWSTAFLIFHMGTMVNWSQLKKEWRTIIMSIIAMLIAMASIIAIIPLIGKEAAIVSIPIINGGIVATQIMTGAALEKGMTIAAALGTIVYAVQKFVGTPQASYFGVKEAKLLVENHRLEKSNPKESISKSNENDSAKGQDKKYFYQKFEKYFTPFVCLALTAFFAYLSKLIGSATGISYSIWALILGATIGFFGFVPPKILEKGQSTGVIQMAVFAAIIPSLAKISFSDLGTIGIQTVLVFVASTVGIYVFLYILPLWKIVGSKNIAVGIAMAQLIGFPATYLIANEIATAIGENDEEKEIIMNKIMPAYVVAGFVSVTSISIIIAGIMVKFL